MNSFIPYIGGKKLLRKKIVDLFPEKFSRYIEVFGGAGWVLFYRDKYANLEVYNDFNGELVNLFRCVKNHADELKRHILLLNSRELFEEYKALQGLPGMTDIQRAAQYYILIRTSFGADIRSYCCTKMPLKNSIGLLDDVQKRLADVVLENRDFRAIFKTYDRTDALFYLDPPYHKTERMYNAKFIPEDHIILKDILANLKGKFILSYNDDPFIRELYKDFSIESVSRANNLSNRSPAFQELLIRNY